MFPNTALILAAGFGKRVASLYPSIPKPLIPIHGISCLERAVCNVISLGITKIIINTHHLAEQINKEAKSLSTKYGINIVTLHEEQILDTGGSILNALEHTHISNILVHNGDIILDNVKNYKDMFIDILQSHPQVQAISLLHNKNLNPHHYNGDFDFTSGPYIMYHNGGQYIWTGLYIIDKSLFTISKKKSFGIMELIIPASQHQLISGIIYNEPWIDIGTISRLESLI